jgi:hypothetical protein
MVDALRDGRPHRASGALGLHVLEIMHAVHEASSAERYSTLRFPVGRPEPFPAAAAMAPGGSTDSDSTDSE